MKKIVVAAVLGALLSASLSAQRLVGMGDSLTAATQSGELTAQNQLASFIKLIADQMSAPVPLALVTGNPFTTAVSIQGRLRIDPAVEARNLAVSGAEVRTLLTRVSDATLDSEEDLMFWPRFGNMIDVAETTDPDLIVCWLGPGDLLALAGGVAGGDVVEDADIVTQFEAVFTELAARLGALDADVVYGNLAPVETAAFWLDNDQLTAFTGTDYELPAGVLTTLPTAVLLDHGLADATIFDDPDTLLDAGEIAALNALGDAFNQIIAEQAAANGAAVADIAGAIADIHQNGVQALGLTLTTDPLGGMFSLDGLHPSNYGHALLANRFIETANSAHGWSIPPLSDFQLALIAFFDPYIDKDGDGRVGGRPFNGLFETLAPILGYAGDLNDLVPDAAAIAEEDRGEVFLDEYRRISGTRKRMRENRKALAERAVTDLFRLK